MNADQHAEMERANQGLPPLQPAQRFASTTPAPKKKISTAHMVAICTAVLIVFFVAFTYIQKANAHKAWVDCVSAHDDYVATECGAEPH